MIATNPNVLGIAFAMGVLVGAAIVLITIWMTHALQEKGHRQGYIR